MIALGLAGFFVARYLAAYQLGYRDHAWDPFFGDGTMRILNSNISHAWPISDAGFGAFAYLLETLSGFMGWHERWRMTPWMVLMFGILVIPLGVTSIVLVILQPVLVGTWCSLCLLTALLMLLMIPLAIDEVVAMALFMARVHQRGKPFWVNFWRGGTPEDGKDDDDDEGDGERVTFHSPLGEMAREMVRGVSLPWTLVAAALLGFWLRGPGGARRERGRRRQRFPRRTAGPGGGGRRLG